MQYHWAKKVPGHRLVPWSPRACVLIQAPEPGTEATTREIAALRGTGQFIARHANYSSSTTSLRKERTEQSQRNELTSRYDDPEFEFGVANIPDDAPKGEGPKVKKVEDTKRELQDILNLQDNQEWVDWARSEMVKPWWTELWDDHLSKNNEKERRKGIGDIQNRILSGEAHGVIKYSTARPCKDAADRPGKDAQESYTPVIFYGNDL